MDELNSTYNAYVKHCIELKQVPMPFNSWLACKIIELEERIMTLERERIISEGDGR